MSKKIKCALIGPGNIGTDLMFKVIRNAKHVQMGAMVGIDPHSDGLARASRMGVATTHEGVEGLTRMPGFAEIDFVFDATSAGAHVKNDAFLRALKPGIRMIDLTPAAIGPYSQGIAAGQTVYVSGQLPIDPATGLIPEGIAAQTAQSLKNIQAILAQQEMTLANVVKTTVFLADINDFAEMNKVYGEYFAQPYPARSAVQVGKLPKDAPLEIECIAVK